MAARNYLLTGSTTYGDAIYPLTKDLLARGIPVQVRRCAGELSTACCWHGSAGLQGAGSRACGRLSRRPGTQQARRSSPASTSLAVAVAPQHGLAWLHMRTRRMPPGPLLPLAQPRQL
jgi:hypothetical protein